VVAEWTLDDRNVTHPFINLPPEVFAAGPELTLTFEIPAPHSPASFGWNTDDTARWDCAWPCRDWPR